MSQTESLPLRDSHLMGGSTCHKIITVECDRWIIFKVCAPVTEETEVGRKDVLEEGQFELSLEG